MADSKNRKNRNPAVAAFLSIIPGLGSLYNGNILKAVAQFLVFIFLIVLALQSPQVGDGFVFTILIAGFYIYQILDSYNEALFFQDETVSLFWAFVILFIGIIFQMANFNLFTYRDIIRFWPVLLIVFGIKILFNYFQTGAKE